MLNAPRHQAPVATTITHSSDFVGYLFANLVLKLQLKQAYQ